MAPTYKVTYFPHKAIAEPIRYLLSYGGVDFEDERISWADYPQHKKDMPFGVMPVLEVDGKQAHQSVAITRYLAKQFKLTGKDDWEDLEIDAIVDTVNDFRLKMRSYFIETDEAIKAKQKEAVPYYLDRLEAVAKANKGHLAVGKLTWADFHFAAIANLINFYCGSNIFADKENLTAVINNVESLPAIKAWMEKRPKSDL